MANGPFDRTIFNVRERPLSSDLNQAEAQLDYSMRALFQQMFSARNGALIDSAVPVTGFVADGFKVRIASPAALAVQVSAGYGFRYDPTDVPAAIGGITGLDDRSPYKPLALLAPQTLNVPAADPVNPRIDIVEVKQDRRAETPLSRDVFNVVTKVFDATLVNKVLSFLQDGRISVNGTASVNYKTGTPAGVPVAPAVTAGYTKIAEVDVPALAAAVNLGQIRDLREVLAPGAERRAAGVFAAVYNGITATVARSVAPPGMQLVVGGPFLNAGASVFTAALIGGNLSGVTPGTTRVAARVGLLRDAAYAASPADNPFPVAEATFARYDLLTTAATGPLSATQIRSLNAGVDATPGQPVILVGYRVRQFDSAGPAFGNPAVGTYYVAVDVAF